MPQNNNKMSILKLVPSLTNAKLNTKTGISAVLHKACECRMSKVSIKENVCFFSHLADKRVRHFVYAVPQATRLYWKKPHQFYLADHHFI